MSASTNPRHTYAKAAADALNRSDYDNDAQYEYECDRAYSEAEGRFDALQAAAPDLYAAVNAMLLASNATQATKARMMGLAALDRADGKKP